MPTAEFSEKDVPDLTGYVVIVTGGRLLLLRPGRDDSREGAGQY